MTTDKLGTLEPNDIEIAENLTIRDWDRLKNRKEDDIDWGEAFKFFEKRICSRYIRPIGVIQDMPFNNGEGFTMVSIQCSLIETIESFYQGLTYLPYRKGTLRKGYYFRTIDEENFKKNVTNEKIFVDFFKEREPFRGKIDGKDFFRKVRCGLLHETQTKGEWVIRKENSDPTIFIEGYGNGKVIYRNNFQAALVKAINNYKEKIVNGDQSEDSTDELRSNFIAKFDHICNQSVVKK